MNNEQQLIQRITELEDKQLNQEIQMAYQTETIEALEQNVTKQFLEIQDLKHQISLLSGLLKTMKQQWSDSGIKPLSEETPPPHY